MDVIVCSGGGWLGGRKRKLAQYDPYDPEESDDKEYEVSLLEV